MHFSATDLMDRQTDLRTDRQTLATHWLTVRLAALSSVPVVKHSFVELRGPREVAALWWSQDLNDTRRPWSRRRRQRRGGDEDADSAARQMCRKQWRRRFWPFSAILTEHSRHLAADSSYLRARLANVLPPIATATLNGARRAVALQKCEAPAVAAATTVTANANE